MSRLRIYEKNGEDMLKLVRFQKERLEAAAGWEEVVYSSREMFVAERKNRDKLGVLADIPIYSILYPQIRKRGRSKTIFGDCKKRKNCYSKERSNRKHISGAVCLLFSYSMFTRSWSKYMIENKKSPW